jgi:hypothetical protein
VEEVLKIKPARYGNEDTIAWFHERTGIFTVKSAYRLAMSEERTNEASSSETGNLDSPLFKKIWKAEVPPKVRIFAWKLAADGLATQDEMAQGTGSKRFV